MKGPLWAAQDDEVYRFELMDGVAPPGSRWYRVYLYRMPDDYVTCGEMEFAEHFEILPEKKPCSS